MTLRILTTAALAALVIAALACNGDGGSTATPTPAPTDAGPGRLPQFTATETPAAAKGWRALAPMPTPRSEVAVAAVAGKIYVVGGFEGDGSPSDAVEAYDPVTDTWSEIAPLPEPRHHAAATAVANHFLYIFGGFAAGFDTARATVYRRPDVGGTSADADRPRRTRRNAHRLSGAEGRVPLRDRR